MSGMLHPNGPEEPQTYWLRRVGVVVAALVVVLLVAWAWPSGGGGGGQTAAPASQTSVTPLPTAVAPTTVPSVSGSATPATGSSISTSPTAGRTPSARSSATKTASAVKTPTASKSPSAPKSSPPTIRECKAGDVHVTLTGTRSVTIGKKTTLKLSVINGGNSTCRLTVDAKTFELKIYSGSDRIWSTADCADWVKPIDRRTVKSQQEVDWTQAWPAQRSHSGCALADNLRPGTYVATAQLTLHGDRAAPVQLVMILHR